LKPNSSVKSAPFGNPNPTTDDQLWLDHITAIPTDSVLFDVYAIDKPLELGGHEILIGTMQLIGDVIRSKWGDENLFFRHLRMDDDLKLMPEWTDYAKQY